MNNYRFILKEIEKLTLNKTFVRNYAFKSDLKIKWVRPEVIPSYKPGKSGDLGGVPPIEKQQFMLDFKNSKELQTANENVKKLFTLEFAPKKFTNRIYFSSLIEQVKRHDYDVGSIEVKMAKWTGVIRAFQDIMERFPTNRRLKVKLKELIDKRKKHLKYLRRWDYKKFEWLLATLNLEYKPHPPKYHSITRKESLQKLTDKYCEDIVQSRLKQYHSQLEIEQIAFLEEKIRTLAFIRDEEKHCGVQHTVTEEEIDEIRKQLDELKQKRDCIA
ncbi:unnamed protein product [Phaedon cochleariae]|uniref:Small ribosomal subunit protein uS15m n=1 Tax=Phaedon cochleariae TaxID=80249 RepID=A0A9P0DAC9_PHACE|nr:unnamed protein product [Phaedon cochleariae]